MNVGNMKHTDELVTENIETVRCRRVQISIKVDGIMPTVKELRFIVFGELFVQLKGNPKLTFHPVVIVLETLANGIACREGKSFNQPEDLIRVGFVHDFYPIACLSEANHKVAISGGGCEIVELKRSFEILITLSDSFDVPVDLSRKIHASFIAFIPKV